MSAAIVSVEVWAVACEVGTYVSPFFGAFEPALDVGHLLESICACGTGQHKCRVTPNNVYSV